MGMITLWDATPTGETTIQTLHGPMVDKVYPPFPLGELVDDLRRALGMPIHRAADALEFDAVDFYAMRKGRKTFSETHFSQVVKLLVEAHKADNPPDQKVFEAVDRMRAANPAPEISDNPDDHREGCLGKKDGAHCSLCGHCELPGEGSCVCYAR